MERDTQMSESHLTKDEIADYEEYCEQETERCDHGVLRSERCDDCLWRPEWDYPEIVVPR